MIILGLISGTSVDGIDAALVEVYEANGKIQAQLIAGETFEYDRKLREEILAVCAGEARTIAQICQLDDRIAEAFAHSAIALVEKNLPRTKPDLIASHGQTVYHRPPSSGCNHGKSFSRLGYSVQLGRGVAIAELTGVTTVSDFRAGDIAAGGQGAPLVPMVDWLLFSDCTENRACQNIGGISNVAYLPASGLQAEVFGFDNAPGNVLIDMATQQLFHQPFDPNGQLAAQGKPCLELVQLWLQQDFFGCPPPKSTGRELFCPEYLQECFTQCNRHALSNYDILATLTEFTASAIAQSYAQFLPKFPDRVLLCGGGSRNSYLVERLRDLLAPVIVTDTDSVGVSADFKEAIAFAVLGYLRICDRPGNLPLVTGASLPVLLGEIHKPF
jgi:anhydro-N-acetylmuramic acid kinase